MINRFPRINSPVYGQNGDEILGSSIGLNKILLNLRDSARHFNRHEWDLILINLFTLARNVFEKTMKVNDLLKAIERDANILTTYFTAYTQYHQSRPTIIAYYVPNYRSINKEILREPTGRKLQLIELFEKVKSNLPQKSMITGYPDPAVQEVLLTSPKSSLLPHLAIPKELRSVISKSVYIKNALILSHCVIDLHVSSTFTHLELVESYTGDLIKHDELGEKLVEGLDLPFNAVTHRIFGDGIHIKPLVKGKQMAALKEAAINNKWYLRTQKEIISDVKKLCPEIDVDKEFKFIT
jgi:hypothetical protein